MRSPINSRKNVFDISSVIAASTNAVVANPVDTVENALLSDVNGVTRGCKIYSIYMSLFFISEGGELAAEVPLVDWYVIKDNGSTMQTAGFVVTGLPTPGTTGLHENKRFILHHEKGLAGGGDVSLTGLPMIFKGVIKIPKGMQTFRSGDRILIIARANFASKFCLQAIYKWFT